MSNLKLPHIENSTAVTLSVAISIGLGKNDDLGRLLVGDGVDVVASTENASAIIESEIAAACPSAVVFIGVSLWGHDTHHDFTTVHAGGGSDNERSEVTTTCLAIIERLTASPERWIVAAPPSAEPEARRPVPAEAVEIELASIAGNVTAEPFPIPARSATPSAEIAPTQNDTAEPIELPTQENNTPSTEIDYDEKSNDLDHQLTLGNEFLFSIDGVGGAPTTAVIARLGDGLYRADISADQNGNYKSMAILFLGEQVDAVYYHAVIVSAEVINNRQAVADWIKKNGVDKADLSVVDFSRCDLSSVRLSECDLSGADFSGADLSNARIIQSEAIGTNFSGLCQ